VQHGVFSSGSRSFFTGTVAFLYFLSTLYHSVRVRVNGTGRRVGRDRVRVGNQDVAVTGNVPRI
jgi:hypothetical protein